ncbi:WD domain-containing protein, G-beta repeat-containing protein [Singulisphaera sp. GP187]|uniref:c-type cytochrome domain-containing protein n=1 Tax=Singulisphaera sp. GP187 TaxID=1882752 RepID=UPI00092B727E|nr:c-type cytochrome domain-containing protein [Singulisphaera sp. GP187]SIN86873.1 WD domain-containing protein, G-beta repeat-containing protein [Singulisphaera sp. GP187]
MSRFRRVGTAHHPWPLMVGRAHPTIAFATKMRTASARVVFGLIAIGMALASSSVWGDEPPTYERDIKPLFAKRCTVCHNTKKLNNIDISGGLALDSFDAVLAGTKDQKVIVPGRSLESALLKRLNEVDEDTRMPLLEKPLPQAQRDLVRHWIDAGAPRGVVVADAAASSANRPRRIVRSLDVVLGVERKIPPKTEGFGNGGAMQVVLKVGPLPAISALAFRGDGRQLAVGTHGEVLIWDLVDARPALVLNDVPGPVHALVFSRDGKRLAVGAGMPARSGSVRVYSVPDGTLIHDFAGHDDVVFGLAFRPDGGQLASASFDQSVRLWNLANDRPDGVFTGHSDFVYDVAYAPDGHSLLSVSKDRTIKLIDAKTLKEKRTYSNHNEDVMALAVQPGGAKFVSAGLEPQLRWWGLDDVKPANRIGGHGGPVHQLAFSGNGKRLISAGGDSSVRLWDGASGTFQRSLPGPTEWQYAVALSDDAQCAAGGGWDGIVRVWDADSGKLRATLLQPPSPSPSTFDWLILTPSGYLHASPDMRDLLRWRIGGADVPGTIPLSVFDREEEVAHQLRGEPVAEPSFSQPKPQ